MQRNLIDFLPWVFPNISILHGYRVRPVMVRSPQVHSFVCMCVSDSLLFFFNEMLLKGVNTHVKIDLPLWGRTEIKGGVTHFALNAADLKCTLTQSKRTEAGEKPGASPWGQLQGPARGWQPGSAQVSPRLPHGELRSLQAL